MKHSICLIAVIALPLVSCNNMANKTKETINKGGETVGKTATEFFEGVSEGVDQTLQNEVSLSDQLKTIGLSTGKYSISSDKQGGVGNVFTIYIIFEQDFNKEILVKAYDKNDLEIGRSRVEVIGKAGDAGYFDFVFDKRTRIISRSKLTLE